MKNFFRDTLITLTIAVVIFLGLQITIPKFVVVGPSMEPNFHNGQLLLVNRMVYKFHEPQRGDVIVLNPPGNWQDDYIKRIIGLPHESVEIRDGVIHIHTGGDVFPLDEPYVADPASSDFIGGIIPPNEYFVLGDNRNNSSDSRNGWTLPREDIVGKAWLSIWPPSNWGLAVNYPLQEQIDGLANN